MIAPEVVRREQEADEVDIAHTCRAHPWASDPPCRIGCVSFCGHVYTGRIGSIVTGPGSSYDMEDCVVCAAMRPKRRT